MRVEMLRSVQLDPMRAYDIGECPILDAPQAVKLIAAGIAKRYEPLSQPHENASNPPKENTAQPKPENATKKPREKRSTKK